jgi:hypothetical protein
MNQQSNKQTNKKQTNEPTNKQSNKQTNKETSVYTKIGLNRSVEELEKTVVFCVHENVGKCLRTFSLRFFFFDFIFFGFRLSRFRETTRYLNLSSLIGSLIILSWQAKKAGFLFLFSVISSAKKAE